MARFVPRSPYWQKFVRRKCHPIPPLSNLGPWQSQSFHESAFRSAPIDFSPVRHFAVRLWNRMSTFSMLPTSLLCSGKGLFKLGSVGQQKSIFIQTQTTPNPLSLMFFPGKAVMEVGSADFPNSRVAMSSPLAKVLYRIDGITRVFYGSDYITVTKAEDYSWDLLKPEIFAAIMDFYTSGQPLFYDAKVSTPSDTAIKEDDDETVAMIKELIETRIRPAVQDDGGDIEYHGFDADTGIVKLRMQGACSGCPSSSVTLKSGIQNMLKHYVQEVKGVEEVTDADSSEEEVGAGRA